MPTGGTAAHAFTLLHESEREAFEAQVASLGVGTTLLVDTYDVTEGVRTAVEVAGTSLGGVRLDSGDLVVQASEVREQLDALGATETKIVVTSDLDEYAIAALAAAPVDTYGVGTRVVTGSGHPTASMVYKLVAREDDEGRMIGVAKKSKDKQSVGGRKYALRPARAARRGRRGRRARARQPRGRACPARGLGRRAAPLGPPAEPGSARGGDGLPHRDPVAVSTRPHSAAPPGVRAG